MKRPSLHILSLTSICALLALGACGKKPEAPAPTPAATTPASAEAAPTRAAEPSAPAEPGKAEPAADPAKTPTEPPTEPTKAPTADEAAPKGGDPAAVEAACAALKERSAKVREAFAKRIAEVPEGAMGPVSLDATDADDYGACVGEGPRDQGTWAIELMDATIDPDSLKEGAEYGAEASLEIGLVWIGPDGATRSTSTSVACGFFSSSLAFHGQHDFDRDGRPDLVIAMSEGSPDHRKTHLQFFRASDTSVERFWKDVEPAVTGLEDIDGDGVLDLLHEEEFLAIQGMNKLAGFPGVTRVAAFDKLEREGEVVRGYYQKKCPKPVKAAELAKFEGEEVDALLALATCAWLQGESNAAIEAALTKAVEQPQLGDGMPIEGPWTKADAKPPFSLR